MRLLKIYNESQNVEVQFKTDLITKNQTNFTVMTVEGLDEAEQELGIDFQKLPYNLGAFEEFCREHGFGLSLQTIGSVTDLEVEVLVEPVEPEDEGEDEDPIEQ